jgi:hypothetical protein
MQYPDSGYCIFCVYKVFHFYCKYVIFADMKRGRSHILIEARDRRMFERYYYWTEVRRMRFDDTIKKLSEEEFFVSESRVMQVVRQMIRDGATVDGKTIQKPLFTGFKIKSSKRKSSAPASELSLFP